MPKIFICGSYAPSLVLFRGDLIKSLLKNGYEVVAAAGGPFDDIPETLAKWGVKFHQIDFQRDSTNLLQESQTVKQVYRLLKLERPDVYFGYTLKPIIYGGYAAHKAGVFHVSGMITGLGYVFSKSDFRSHILEHVCLWLYKQSLRNYKSLFFQNQEDEQFFRSKNLIQTKTKIYRTGGSGVDVEHFKPTDFPNKLSFLMVARLTRTKGVEDFLKAAEIIKSKYPQVEIRLAGWFDKKAEAISEETIQSAVRRKIITFDGYVDDVRKVISQSSVYVLPSYREGMPRTVLEAMAMGRPIITTDTAGCRDTVEEGKNGFLVPIKDPQAVALAMEKFIVQPELISPMGQRSRELVERKFDVRQVNAQIIETLGS